MNKNTALYLRVSTDDQAKECYSLEVQKEFLGFFAKRGVEMAIEKDEKQAHNWINSELKNLNIK